MVDISHCCGIVAVYENMMSLQVRQKMIQSFPYESSSYGKL